MADDETVTFGGEVTIVEDLQTAGPAVEALRRIRDEALVLVRNYELTPEEVEAQADAVAAGRTGELSMAEITHRGIVVSRANAIIEEVEALGVAMGYTFGE